MTLGLVTLRLCAKSERHPPPGWALPYREAMSQHGSARMIQHR